MNDDSAKIVFPACIFRCEVVAAVGLVCPRDSPEPADCAVASRRTRAPSKIIFSCFRDQLHLYSLHVAGESDVTSYPGFQPSPTLGPLFPTPKQCSNTIPASAFSLCGSETVSILTCSWCCLSVGVWCCLSVGVWCCLVHCYLVASRGSC